jgi:5-methylcytosine-specific restriction protein B
MADITIQLADAEIFQRYTESRRWNEAPAADQQHLRDIRNRLNAIARAGREEYPGKTPVQDFLSILNPNGRTPKDYWCCIFPQAVPNKSFGLQIALIVKRDGCEVCFCLGAGTSQERDSERLKLNAIALERTKAGLSDVPSELRRGLEAACRDGGWSYRKSWRQAGSVADFNAIDDWLAYACSPSGNAASISQDISLTILAEDPGRPVRLFKTAVQLFAPLVDHVYGEKYVERSGRSPKTLELPAGLAEPAIASDAKKTRYWLLAAGEGARLWPDFQENGIAAIGWDGVGNLSNFRTRDEIATAITGAYGAENPMNAALACFQFAQDIEIGDYIYVKKGNAEIVGHGVVTSDYRFSPERPEYRHVRDIDWLSTGLWSVPEGRRLPQKTLTEIDSETAQFLDDMLSRPETPSKPLVAAPYAISDALQELFIGKDELELMLNVLGRKQNLVLAGPPGVGKTFAARKLAYLVMGERDPFRVKLLQFHQSLSYEDFVQGWRPTTSGQLAVRPGPFLVFAEKARVDRERKHVLIIDEINRGNLSKIFGDLLMLLEVDKRDISYAIPLTYASAEDQEFVVPPNLYIIGMMNTADRSLALVDYALRRRFGFAKMVPQFGSQGFRRVLTVSGAGDDLINRIIYRMNNLNSTITADSDLGAGFLIGHSYFLPTGREESLDEAWYRQVVQTDIIPLLEEYWFDRKEEVEAAAGALLA